MALGFQTKEQVGVEKLGALEIGKHSVYIATFDSQLVEVAYIASAMMVGADPPASRVLELINTAAAGNGTTVMATLNLTAGVTINAFDKRALTLSTVPGALDVVEGDILAFRSTPIGGTGMVDPSGLVAVTVARRYA